MQGLDSRQRGGGRLTPVLRRKKRAPRATALPVSAVGLEWSVERPSRRQQLDDILPAAAAVR